MQAPSHDLRIVFAGTPAFAAAHLDHLIGSPFQPVAVYTQPDRKAGRGKRLTPSPVKQLAGQAGIPVFQPDSLKHAEAINGFAALAPDLLIVVAYGLILPQAILDVPTRGCINVHASLLPRWRGAAPIQRAIEAGDSETGICIMQMDAGLDTGDILSSASLPIMPDMTAGALHDALAGLGPTLLQETLEHLDECQSNARPQPEEGVTYAHKIEKDEARMDFSLPAEQVLRRILAFNPFPGAWTTLAGERLKCWGATLARGTGAPGEILAADGDGIIVACGEQAVLLTHLQLPNARAMAVRDILNARRDLFAPGTRLGTD